ncbi:MAG: hypothetical protein GY708_10030 [Actinomycetia bacterium]|nr:hypothetical protein [Actinomycetes bacterium]
MALSHEADEVLSARGMATRLRNVLRVNVGFSAVTGTLALVLGGQTADLLGLDPAWIVPALGAGLLGFAGVVFGVAGARTSTLLDWSRIISVADFGWVAATAAVIAAGWLSTTGAIVMGLIGLVVFELGLAQLRWRKRLATAMTATDVGIDVSPAVEVIEFL